VLRLATSYYRATGDAGLFRDHAALLTAAYNLVVDTVAGMQAGTGEDPSPAYQFQRTASEPTDTLLHGIGAPCRRTVRSGPLGVSSRD
jgi:meiotically up-regulated gene 157 (Mug157) protein